MRALYANEPEMSEMMKAMGGIDFTPPASVRAAAKAGLAKRREFGRGGTEVGIARARDLSGGKSISPDTARRMVSFFARHEVDKQASGFNAGEEGYPSNGRIAWELWGGDAGQAWANKLVRQMEAAETTKEEGKGYGARAGETIRGNLTRGNDGKFASAGSSQPAAAESEEAPPLRRQKLGRAAAAREERKRRTTEAKRQARAADTEKRRQERAARREAEKKRRQEAKRAESDRKLQENRKKVLEATDISDESMRALEAFARGEELEFDSELADSLVDLGLVIPTGPGGENYRMGAAGRALLGAIKSGDLRQAKDAITTGREAVEKRREARRRKLERMEREKEASGLSVFKDAKGRYRWVLLSSNAYRDRDGEIISTKALAQDVARADADGDYGPLRWWHMPGMDIGDCDFNALSGRVLVESGTFRNEAIGEAVFKAQRDLQASIGFRHPHTEPDREKVYHSIRRFERSLVPSGRAANRLTKLVVNKQGERMNNEKLEALKAIIGEDGIKAIVDQVQATQKEADAQGIAFKEASEQAVTTGSAGGATLTLTPSEVARQILTPTATSVTIKGDLIVEGEVKASKDDAAADDTADDDSFADDGRVYAGDLEPGELATIVAGAVAQALVPALGEVVKELKTQIGTTRKDDDIALLQEQASRKAQEDAQTIAALKAQQEALATQFKEVSDKLAELAGEQPRAVQQGYRASQAPDTAINQQHRLKEAQPAGFDPNFFSDFLGGGNNHLPPQ